MATTTAAAPRSRSRSAGGAALGAGLLGLVLAGLLYRFPPQLGLSLAGGVAMIAVLALAVARYHAAVALAFALLGVVLVEPAPSDGVFVVLMAIALVGRRFRLAAVPFPVVAALGTLAAFNFLSAVQVADPQRAASYFLITVFVGAMAFWLSGYVVTRGRARLVVRAYLVAAGPLPAECWLHGPRRPPTRARWAGFPSTRPSRGTADPAGPSSRTCRHPPFG